MRILIKAAITTVALSTALLCAGSARASDVTLVNAMKAKLDYTSERHNILAHNIANANTPKFIPKDLKSVNFNQMVQPGGEHRLQMQRTSPMHLAGERGNIAFHEVLQKPTFETNPQGNQVALEEQALKLSENSADYDMTLNLFKQMNTLMRAAVGGQ